MPAVVLLAVFQARTGPCEAITDYRYISNASPRCQDQPIHPDFSDVEDCRLQDSAPRAHHTCPSSSVFGSETSSGILTPSAHHNVVTRAWLPLAIPGLQWTYVSNRKLLLGAVLDFCPPQRDKILSEHTGTCACACHHGQSASHRLNCSAMHNC